MAASGDTFFASKEDLDQRRNDLPECTRVEMEGAAVAQVCRGENTNSTYRDTSLATLLYRLEPLRVPNDLHPLSL